MRCERIGELSKTEAKGVKGESQTERCVMRVVTIFSVSLSEVIGNGGQGRIRELETSLGRQY